MFLLDGTTFLDPISSIISEIQIIKDTAVVSFGSNHLALILADVKLYCMLSSGSCILHLIHHSFN